MFAVVLMLADMADDPEREPRKAASAWASCSLYSAPYVLVFLKAHLLDEALHARVYRRYVALHLCVIGVFHVAPVYCTAQCVAQEAGSRVITTL